MEAVTGGPGDARADPIRFVSLAGQASRRHPWQQPDCAGSLLKKQSGSRNREAIVLCPRNKETIVFSGSKAHAKANHTVLVAAPGLFFRGFRLVGFGYFCVSNAKAT